VSRDAQSASKSIQEFAQANGQILLPLVELITQVRVAVDDVIQSIGRQTIETILTLSAQELAGTRCAGQTTQVVAHCEIGGAQDLASWMAKPDPELDRLEVRAGSERMRLPRGTGSCPRSA